MKRSLTLALLFGVTATIGFCLAVWSWNLAFESAASWRIPLNVFSFPGLLASALAFPCKDQDVQIGCEWYHLPAFTMSRRSDLVNTPFRLFASGMCLRLSCLGHEGRKTLHF